MTNWQRALSKKNRRNHAEFSHALLKLLDCDCLTRKPRSSTKRDLMKQIGLPEKFSEVQYPSPDNTPADLELKEI